MLAQHLTGLGDCHVLLACINAFEEIAEMMVTAEARTR